MTPQERRKAEARARRVQAQEHQAKAVELRKRGLTYRSIAQQLGISAPAVYKSIKKAMDQLRAQVYIDVGTIRTMDLEKLDAVEMGMWPGVSKGNHNAANTILKAMDQRAKHLGLYAPEKHANTDSHGNDICNSCQRLREMSDDEVKARIRELQGEMGDGGLVDP